MIRKNENTYYSLFYQHSTFNNPLLNINDDKEMGHLHSVLEE